MGILRSDQVAIVNVVLPMAKVNAHSHGVSMRIEAGWAESLKRVGGGGFLTQYEGNYDTVWRDL